MKNSNVIILEGAALAELAELAAGIRLPNIGFCSCCVGIAGAVADAVPDVDAVGTDAGCA